MAAIRRLQRLQILNAVQLRKDKTFRERVDPFRLYTEHELFLRYKFNQRGIDFLFDLLEDDLRAPTLRSHAIPPSTKIRFIR